MIQDADIHAKRLRKLADCKAIQDSDLTIFDWLHDLADALEAA